MSFDLFPGNALACRVNAHRHGWNGQICDNPTTWECGGRLDFREDYCARGRTSCFHLHLFDPQDPRFIIESRGAGWIFESDIHAFDDQLVILWNKKFREPRGMIGTATSSVVYGVYRVQSVERIDRPYRVDWLIRPHADGWVHVAPLGVPFPRAHSMGGLYVLEVEKSSVVRMFEQIRERAAELDTSMFSAHDRACLDHFSEHLEEWIEVAAAKVPARPRNQPRTVASTDPAGSGHRPFAGLPDLIDVGDSPRSRPPAEAASGEPPKAPPESTAVVPIVGSKGRSWIEENYGADTLRSILIGSLTKSLLILAGRPGVGKSTLATQLIDDPKGERLLTVAVASTWRGREDLLGYVNPISGRFEPTRFTNFLREAARAWESGDRRPRLVVFEEFNLSQPEFWLSEILVRGEYAAGDITNRTIDLGGTAVEGWPTDERPQVFLSPAVRYVATVNTDHTSRTLSPRVLDRAAVVELRVDAGQIIENLNLNLDSEQIEAIKELDYRGGSHGAGFSYRSAVSLRSCLEQARSMGLDAWEILDVLLVQEVLSKVRLLAGDGRDAEWLDLMIEWSNEHGARLPQCALILSTWRECLAEGRDVIQA
ncbi:MAG TPA: hypothetical protein ENK43_04530 [Planctomycetes bacterium]|nr:hypothetical protein [Planctomycetota bacterium]